MSVDLPDKTKIRMMVEHHKADGRRFTLWARKRLRGIQKLSAGTSQRSVFTDENDLINGAWAIFLNRVSKWDPDKLKAFKHFCRLIDEVAKIERNKISKYQVVRLVYVDSQGIPNSGGLPLPGWSNSDHDPINDITLSSFVRWLGLKDQLLAQFFKLRFENADVATISQELNQPREKIYEMRRKLAKSFREYLKESELSVDQPKPS
ncbi:Uncharacterised protein [Halioglobus japonicus]|nr:Uncharacterised protein [Halioglobus japonicus]